MSLLLAHLWVETFAVLVHLTAFVAITVLGRRFTHRHPPPELESLRTCTPCELAYLYGGPGRVLLVALHGLLSRDALTVREDDGKLRSTVREQELDNEWERMLAGTVRREDRSAYALLADTNSQLATRFHSFDEQLVEQGWLFPLWRMTSSRTFAILALVVLFVIGIIAFVLSASHEVLGSITVVLMLLGPMLPHVALPCAPA